MRVANTTKQQPSEPRAALEPKPRSPFGLENVNQKRRRGSMGEERDPAEPQPLPPPLGGPLGLHRAPERPEPSVPAVGALVDRIVVGKTRDGLAEVRLDVSAGILQGTEVRLIAGARGLEATFVTATEAARRVVEAQLTDLARALEGRGIHVARCNVTSMEAERDRQHRQQRRQQAEDQRR